MKYLLSLFLFFSVNASAQKIKVVLDSVGNHGFFIHDSIVREVTWREAYRYGESMKQAGWRTPTPVEQKEIFDKTVDKRRSYGVIPSGYYFSTILVQEPGDTLPRAGRMYGKYALILAETTSTGSLAAYYNVFLVRPF